MKTDLATAIGTAIIGLIIALFIIVKKTLKSQKNNKMLIYRRLLKFKS